LSSGYSICLQNDDWRKKLAEIKEGFCISDTRKKSEDLEIIRELVEKFAILRRTAQGVTFNSENIKHKVMTEFVIHCIKTDKDYKTYLGMTSLDSVLEYCTFWGYFGQTDERCLYIPNLSVDVLIQRLGRLAVVQSTRLLEFDYFKSSMSN
jgi:hypothetical protein